LIRVAPHRFYGGARFDDRAKAFLYRSFDLSVGDTGFPPIAIAARFHHDHGSARCNSKGGRSSAMVPSISGDEHLTSSRSS